MEILFQIFAEVLLQLVLELLFELGVRSVREVVTRPPNPWLAAIGYALLGSVAGGISLVFFPSLLLKTPTARLVNLLLAPVAAGAAMALLGRLRQRKKQGLIRLDKFAYGYLFALAMAIVRFASCD